MWIGLCGGAWSQVPRDSGTQDKNAQTGQNSANQPNPIVAAVNPQPSPSKQKDSAYRQPSEYPWRELYGPANIPNWFLVLLGAGGIFAAVRTLRSISLQANLMREQLDRMVERERARLSIEVQPLRIDDNLVDESFRLISCLELTNGGHSNAYIRFGAARFVVIRSGEGMPTVDPDDLPFGSEIIEPSKPPVYAGFWGEQIPFRLEMFTAGLVDSTLRVCLYGFVEYESMGIVWHRDFGYIWKIWDEAVGDDSSSVVSSNPKNPEEMFVGGQWEQNASQKNREYRVPKNPN